MSARKSILVIAGTVRPNRISPDVAAWVAAEGRELCSHDIETIDLADWPLPMDGEPGIPAFTGYATPQTQAWSAKIDAADAIVFVTPQYNWGYPASLKNAIDHLHREWRDKPALIVTYGGHGGGRCATALRQVLDGIKMRTVTTMPALVLPRPMIEANTGKIDPAVVFAESRDNVRQGFGELIAELR